MEPCLGIFFSGKDWKSVCVWKGRGKYLGSIIYVFFDRPKREINCFFGAESLNNTLPPSNSKSNLSHRYFIASISRHIHQPVSTPLNSLSIPLDLHHHRAHRAPTTTMPFHHPDGTETREDFHWQFYEGIEKGGNFSNESTIYLFLKYFPTII